MALEAEKLAKKAKKKGKGGAPSKSKFGSKASSPGLKIAGKTKSSAPNSS